MSQRNKGARLYLRPASRDAAGRIVKPARWIIRDGGRQFGTRCGAGDRAGAEKQLSRHIAQKYAPARKQRDLDQIPVSDVIGIYLRDVAPGHARPKAAGERAERLLEYFGKMTLDCVNGPSCRDYVAFREGRGQSKKGTGGGARRDLQDLAAAINHHAREGLHRGIVLVALPKRGEARQRWLTRSDAARLLWTCWRMRETQEGQATAKRPLAHLCRFLIMGLYTGSRPGAILSAAWDRGPARSWVDIDGGRFYRLAEGAIATAKRQPVVRLSPRLKAHCARWRRLDGGRGHVVTFGGQPIQSVKTALARAQALAGIEAGVSAYTLRHTAASWLVAKGLPTRLVADFLGTSETMILDHYGHLAPDYQDAAAEAIGRK